MDIRQIIEGAAQLKASDIHLSEGVPPYLRVDGDLMPVFVKREEISSCAHRPGSRISKEVVPVLGMRRPIPGWKQ